MTTEVVYLGHDNTIDVQLLEDGVITDLSSVTRMTLDFAGTVIDSGIHSNVFDWSAGNGLLNIALGAQTITEESYLARLVVYDPVNADGVVWGHVDILVRDG